MTTLKNRNFLLLLLALPLLTMATPAPLTKKEWLAERLVNHIARAKQADAYWAKVQHAPISNFLTNLTTFGLRGSWQQALTEKRAALEQSIIKTAEILGELEQSQNTDTVIKKHPRSLFTEQKNLLQAYQEPSYLAQHWPKYALSTISTLTLYYIITKKITIQSIKGWKDDFWKNHIKGPVDDAKNHFKKIKSDERSLKEAAKSFQEDVNVLIETAKKDPITAKLIEKHAINLEELKIAQKDEQGRIIRNIFDSTMREIFTTNTLNTEEPKRSNGTVESISESITDVKQAASETKKVSSDSSWGVGKTIGGWVGELAGGALNRVDSNNTIKNTTENIERASDQLLEFIQDNKKNATTILSFIANIIATNPDLAPLGKLAFQAFLLEIQGGKITVLELKQRSNLPILALGAIPAAVVCYGTYKGINGIYHKVTDMRSTEPLRKDLIQFQLHLNRNRHKTASELSYFYHGMSYYWTKQLETYVVWLPSKYHTSYETYMEELRNRDFTPEQKMMIIESMFKEYNFL